jgi:hypothetical protein
MFSFDLIYCRSRFRSEAPLTKPQNFQGLLSSKLTRSQAEGSRITVGAALAVGFLSFLIFAWLTSDSLNPDGSGSLSDPDFFRTHSEE